MGLELHDGKISGSSGVAKAGVTLGIIGTALGVLNGGVNGLGWFGNNRNFGFNGSCGNGSFGYNYGTGDCWGQTLQSEIAQLRAEKYTDAAVADLYTYVVQTKADSDSRVNAVQNQMCVAFSDLDKRTALNEQASRLNREYDTMARDYMMTIVNNKIDCCCEKQTMQSNFDRKISELADASIISYVNSNFIPGQLKLSASNICPGTLNA